MWRRDPVSHLMQDSIGRVRTQVGTVTQGRFRTEGLVIAEMITKQECLSRVGVRQDGKQSGRRDRLGRSGVQRSFSGGFNRPHLAQRTVSVYREFNHRGTTFPVRGFLQLRKLWIPPVSYTREHSERIILKFLRSALAQHLKAAGVRYAHARCLSRTSSEWSICGLR